MASHCIGSMEAVPASYPLKSLSGFWRRCFGHVMDIVLCVHLEPDACDIGQEELFEAWLPLGSKSINDASIRPQSL